MFEGGRELLASAIIGRTVRRRCDSRAPQAFEKLVDHVVLVEKDVDWRPSESNSTRNASWLAREIEALN